MPSSKENTEQKPTLVSRVLTISVNLISFGVFAATAVVLRSTITPVRRGFFCNDYSIRYPVLHTQTVKTSTLLATSFSLAAVIIFITEYIKMKKSDGKHERFCFLRLSLPLYTVQSVKLFVLYCWGVIATSVITDVLKVSSGVLRPNFFYACKPNVTCDSTQVDLTYHEDYICQGVGPEHEASLRSSFPSGHSSQAIFAASFLIVYTYLRFRNVNTALLLPTLQLALSSAALWSCMTRVTDHVHHYNDVLFGIIIGVCVGIFFGSQVTQWVKKTELTLSMQKSDEERHLATLRSDTAGDQSPNGQV